jgi:hypothetical protein
VKPTKPKPMTREVYAIANQKTGALKIGMAIDPPARLKNLQTGSASQLELAHSETVEYASAPKVETLARHIGVSLGKKKTREWLAKTTPEEGREYIETAHNIIRGKNQHKEI